MKNRSMRTSVWSIALATVLLLTAIVPAIAQPLSGAVFTTDSDCTGVDLNIYDSKEDVYLDGGPEKATSASLPDGEYYVKVTDPSGKVLLGTSVDAPDKTPFKVVNGASDGCIQLMEVLVIPDGDKGFDNTPNPGGEYKVWVSADPSFPNKDTKTDNFKAPGEYSGPA